MNVDGDDRNISSTLILKKMVNVKLSLCLINSQPFHGDVWGTGVIAPSFLTSAPDESDLSDLQPGSFTAEKRAL
jgi:hypothetical protein